MEQDNLTYNMNGERPGLKNHPQWAVGLLLFLFALTINSLFLHAGPLAKSEGIRALTGHQLLDSGQWAVTRLYGAVYMQKPPLFYWAAAASELVFQHGNEWVWRFPSALAASLLIFFLWGMSSRWYGRRAGNITGLSSLFLLVLWSQIRSAEIDMLNNALAVMAACCMIELIIAPARRSNILWGIAGGVFLGGMLLAKGPAGMPLILGTMIGAAAATRSYRKLLRPAFLFIFLLGGTLFSLWVWRAHVILAMRNWQADTAGMREVAWRVFSIRALKNWPEVITLPLLVTLYSFPVSGVLPFISRHQVLSQMPERQYSISKAILGTLLGSFAFCILFLIPNPRYAYMIPPLFPLLAGATAYAIEQGFIQTPALKNLRGLVGVSFWLLATGAIFFAVRGHFIEPTTPFWTGAAILTLAILAILTHLRFRQKKTLQHRVLPVLLVLTSFSIGFDQFLITRRWNSSGYQQGIELSQMLPGKQVAIHAETMVRYHPELFYYADVQVRRHPKGIDEDYAPADGGIYVLHEWEVEDWVPHQQKNLTLLRELPGPDTAFVYQYHPESTKSE